MDRETKVNLLAWPIMIVILAFCGALIIAAFFGVGAIYRQYSLWSSSMAGQAELKQAEWSRQIAVVEAQAKRDGAIMLAQAEIERAKGVAQANKIIGDSLKGNEDYLRYLWIDHLGTTQNQTIYIPTEAGLPILEAGKRKTQIISAD